MENYKFKIQIGDISGAGHEKSKEYIIESNLASDRLVEIYKKTAENIGYSPSDFCEEYDDNSISVDSITNMGLTVDNYTDLYVDDTGYYFFSPDDFCKLIIDYIITHNSTVKMVIISDDLPILDLGNIGCGLFY